MKEELDKNEITCPYCGHKYDNSFEYHDNGTTNCESCCKEFSYEVIHDYTYSTYSLKDETNEQ